MKIYYYKNKDYTENEYDAPYSLRTRLGISDIIKCENLNRKILENNEILAEFK